MSVYRFILLDWDGNLAKTLDVWLEACRQPLAKRNIHLTDKEIATCFGAAIEKFTEWGVKDIDEAIEEMVALARQKMPEVELYPDALTVLERLKQKGKKLALITTSRHKNIQHVLDKYEMRHYFEVIVAGDDVSNHKPHPEPLEKAIVQLGANKKESIMVGDTEKDLGAANNAGIDSVLFYPPEHKKFYKFEHLNELNPTYMIDDFNKLLNIVG